MNPTRCRIVFNLSRAWLLCKLLVAPLQAQTVATRIVADPAAPSAQRATILPTANGVVQVNIRTPSAAGVSRNTYSEFDVGGGAKSGVILNNSRTGAQTQLGGWVTGNDWLATGSARVILNEVNSSNPSRLQGYVEVAGPSAQVVIANPSGIAINGGGFINASGVTLTTGVPVMSAGALSNFSVQGGQVTVEGLGLDTRSASYTAILSRALQVNAGIWAQQLQVLTGANDIAAASVNAESSPQSVPIAGTGQAPAFSLDVAALGGMYAGKIHLVGTEAGVGARNAGWLQADSGALTLSHQGWLSNSGALLAFGGDVAIQTQGAISQSGVIYSDRNVQLNARSSQTHSGTVAALGDVHIQATTGDLQATGSDVLAGKSVHLQTARTLTTDQAQVQANTLTLQAQALSNVGGSIVSQGDLTLSLQGDHTLAGTWQAGGDLQLQTTGTLTNPVRVQAGKNLSLQASDLDNQITGQLLAGQTTHLAIANTLTQRGLIDGADTRIQATTVNNLGTGRIYGDRVAIAADTLINQEETVANTTRAATIAGRERVDIGVNTLDNREGALIYSGGDMTVGRTLDANWRAGGSALRITNNSATLEAAKALVLEATSIRNTNAHFASEVRAISQTPIKQYQHAPGDVVSASDNSTRFSPEQAHITDCESFCMHSPAGTSDAFVRYDFTRSVAQTVVTQSAPGKILAGQSMRLTADSVFNDKSQIVSGGALDVPRGSLTQQQGEGIQITTDVGTATSYWRIRKNRRDTYGNRTSGYAPAPVQQAISLNAARYEANMSLAAAGSAPQKTAASAPPVRTQTGPATLPSASLYRQHPEPAARYLIETDPQFTQYKTWLGSDYMIAQLRFDHATAQKRMGDGFYEQQLVRDQVLALTGRRFLGHYTDDQAQYMALMNNGLTYAQALDLRPGIALSAAQVAQLTSDMVWLVTQEVVLGDGSRHDVLVPQVYVRVQPGDIDGTGALLSGREVTLDLAGDAINSGTIAGRTLVNINARNIRNLGGHIRGATVALQATQDIDDIGGHLQAQDAALLSAGRDIHLTSTTQSSTKAAGANRFSQTGIDRVASLYVSGPAGVLIASAGRDLTLTAAQIRNDGTGPSLLSAGRDLTLNTLTTRSDQDIQWSSVNYLRQSNSQEVGSQITTPGDLTLSAGQDVNARAANVQSAARLSVQAGRDVNITAGEASQSLDTANQVTRKGTLSRRTLRTRETSHSTTAQSSNLEGQDVDIRAGQDLGIRGANILADQSVALSAGRNITVEAAQNTHRQTSERQETKSGMFSSGGIGLTIGKQQQNLALSQTQTSAAASTLGAIGGGVTVTAGQTYTQTGSDVLTPAGDLRITAKTVTIQEAREISSQSVEQQFKQSGLTVAITSPVVAAVQTAQDQVKAAGDTRSSRMKTLAAANAAMNVAQAVDALQVGQAIEGGNAADKAGGIGISFSLGSSRSQARQSESADNARGSRIAAGGAVTVQATGAGKDSDLTVQGSDLQATGVTTLLADDAVRLLAARNIRTEDSRQSSHSASVGANIQLGSQGFKAGVTLSASAGKGQGAGNDTTYTHSHIEGGPQVVIQSGGDTTLQGATVKADQITAQVGGDLAIQSLQERSVHQEKSQQIAGSVTLGPAGGASLSVGQTRIHSDYLSVVEQSALRAGDGGFQVNVQGQTQLTGGQITSTQAAVDASKNRYQATEGTTTTDLHNKANYEASSVSVSLGTGTPSPGAPRSAGLSGVGFGSDSGSAASTTQAGISGAAGHAAARTGDASSSLQPIFDKERAQKEVAAQVAITSEFGKQTSKVVGDYAALQLKKAQAADDTAGIDAWREGGTHRVAMHAVVGGLSGGPAGAIGAGASQTLVPWVGDALREADLPLEVKQALVLAAGTVVGAATGGTAGAATGFNATANNYLFAYDGKIIARDTVDNNQVIVLTPQDKQKLAASEPAILMKEVAGIDADGAPSLVKDERAAQMTSSTVYDLTRPEDQSKLQRQTDMGYLNLDGKGTRIYVQTGMQTKPDDALKNAQTLSRILGEPVGVIVNSTQGLGKDIEEYLPKAPSLKDALNEYTYQVLNAQGDKLVVLHSAGNEDAKKALQLGQSLGHQYGSLSFVSLGSPLSNSVMRHSVTQPGAMYLGQVNDWRDPVTHPALWVAGTATMAASGFGATQAILVGAAAGPAGWIAIGGSAAAVGLLTLGKLGVNVYHPLDNYITKPQAQSILFNWARKSALPKGLP